MEKKQVDYIVIQRVIGGFTVGIGGHHPTHIAMSVQDVVDLVTDALLNGRPVEPWELLMIPTVGPIQKGESDG